MRAILQNDDDRKAVWAIGFIVLMPALLYHLPYVLDSATGRVAPQDNILLVSLFTLGFAPLAVTMLENRRVLARGPKQVLAQAQLMIGLIAVLMAQNAPAADMSLIEALRDWMVFLVIIGVISGFDLATRLVALRRQPRALRVIGRRAGHVVIWPCLAVAVIGMIDGASAAQILWASVIAVGTVAATVAVLHGGRRLKRRLGRYVKIFADVASLSALALIWVIITDSGSGYDMTGAIVGGATGLVILWWSNRQAAQA